MENNNENRKVDKKLKIVHFNCNNKSNLTPEIGPLISNQSSNILLSINETFALHDLSIYKLHGVRHQNPLCRGLSFFISDHLRYYTDVFYSAFSIYGLISLPSNDDTEALKIAFIATYRSPSLLPDQEKQFFEDLNEVACKLLDKTTLIYVMGDLNVYEKRFFKNDPKKIAPTPPCKNSKAFQTLMESIPGPSHFYFNEPTHFPHQNNIQTCSQLDYIFAIYAGDRVPKGKTTVWVTTSDHRALLLVVNIPFLQNIKVRFKTYDRVINTSFLFIDSQLAKAATKMKWDPEHCWDNLSKIEIYRDHLLEAHSLTFRQRRPTNTRNFEAKIKILQNKAQIARDNNDWWNYDQLTEEIREAITLKATTALKDCSENDDKQSGLFYKWAGSILKPNKSEQGKFTMINKTVAQITDPINANYIDSNPLLPMLRISTPEQIKSLVRACNLFDFKKVLGKIRKVPVWFKQCKYSVVYLAERLTLGVILGEFYPPVLKLCQADILPSRSIFQMLNPFSKLVENFFASQLQKILGQCQNFAYRPNLSTTSLLLVQFDHLARNDLVYAFNGDLMKAFDRLSRKLVYESIENSALANIIYSWLDRLDSPYFLWWRGDYVEISRDNFNRGCPPGSICGPITYILGQSDHLHYQSSMFKAYFADDNLPIYLDQEVLWSEAADFVDFMYRNGMEMHVKGSKAAVFLVFGKRAPTVNLDAKFLNTDMGMVEIKRSYGIRQLGLDIIANPSNGRAEIELDKIINRLKHASVSIRVLSQRTISSVMLELVRTYLISVVSYGIIIWYPLMSNYDVKKVNSLRYWYYSVVCYICADSKQLLSWSNSSHTIRKGHSCETRFKELCGIPTLEELALASTKAHYPQILNMVQKGWLKNIVYEGRLKLHYLRGFDLHSKKAISPLRVCIDLLNEHGYDKIHFNTKDSWLMLVETELKNLTKEEIRFFQRTITVMHFKIEKEYFERVKKGDKIKVFFSEKEKQARKILKRLKRLNPKSNFLL